MLSTSEYQSVRDNQLVTTMKRAPSSTGMWKSVCNLDRFPSPVVNLQSHAADMRSTAANLAQRDPLPYTLHIGFQMLQHPVLLIP